jgi:hypothetical protein
MTRSRIINSFLALTLIGSFLFVNAGPAKAAGASLYLSPSTGTYVINGTFKVSVMVNSGGEAINAAEGAISYDADLLEATSLSKGNIFMFWTTEPKIGAGSIVFGGGNPGPYTGSSGHVLTVSFKAKKAGTAQVRFTSGAVLANDGKGTNILASMGSGSYTISPKVDAPKADPSTPKKDDTKPAVTLEPEYNKPVIKSASHPDQNSWYQSGDIKFTWDLPRGVTGVSLALDEKPVSDPGPNSDGLIGEKEYKDVAGGVWYLHVKFKDAVKWGTVNHYRVMIDRNPPKPFQIKLKNIEPGEWPILEFETKDDESGLDRYEIYVGSLEHQAHQVPADKNSMQLADLEPGSHTVLMKAIDKAGNQRVETIEFFIEAIPTPLIVNFSEEIRPGDKFFMNGTAIENGAVLVYLESENRLIASSSAMVDANGNWFYIHDEKLPKGRYIVYAKALNELGMQSEKSAHISFLVSPPVFAELGAFIIDYFTVIVSLLFMIVLIILIIFFLVYFAKKKLKKETIEVEDVLKRSLGSFKKEIDEEFEAMIDKDARVTGKKDKAMIRDRLKKRLVGAEEKIMKEVRDVEDMLD